MLNFTRSPLGLWLLISASFNNSVAKELLHKKPRKLQIYSSYDDYYQEMLNAVNAERAKLSLSALCANEKLAAAAARHSEDMASNDFMGHTGANGSTLSERVSGAEFAWTKVAENVAAGQKDVASVMQSWMSSKGHRDNILSADYIMLGTSYVYRSDTTYKHYWTQNFGASDSEICDGGLSSVNTNQTQQYTDQTPQQTDQKQQQTDKRQQRTHLRQQRPDQMPLLSMWDYVPGEAIPQNLTITKALIHL
ncbi:hypothetical protein CCR75_000465 [Bremia lactucae]|uniref:SCP domain-containing protein n=1 Tax=Bremia lactucae TaxID=4779 RepID=A0A976FLQ1_BRELC|nr:hypothetical protein CCR75_000465 [Bremia lactucae]